MCFEYIFKKNKLIFTGSTHFPTSCTPEDVHYSDERDCKSYPDYSYSYSQNPSKYIDEITYRNSQVPTQDRRHRRRLSNYSHHSNVNRGFHQISELNSLDLINQPRNIPISPTRNRQGFHSQVAVDRNDEHRSSIRKYSKSLACTPTNARLPNNMMNREDFTTYSDRAGRSQSVSQSRHRRFNSTSNWLRSYTDCNHSETNSHIS